MFSWKWWFCKSVAIFQINHRIMKFIWFQINTSMTRVIVSHCSVLIWKMYENGYYLYLFIFYIQQEASPRAADPRAMRTPEKRNPTNAPAASPITTQGKPKVSFSTSLGFSSTVTKLTAALSHFWEIISMKEQFKRLKYVLLCVYPDVNLLNMILTYYDGWKPLFITMYIVDHLPTS